jgi:hypothetical protein
MQRANIPATGKNLKRVTAIGLLIFFSFTSAAWSQKTAPKSLAGFGGLQWGDSTAKFKEMEPSAKLFEPRKDIQYGIGSLKSAKIGIESMAAPKYVFYKDRYYLFSAGFADEGDFTLLEEALISKYGPPGKSTSLKSRSKPNEKTGVRLYWEIEKKISITLRWSQLNEGELVYCYLPIMEEISSEQKESIKENL